MRLYHYAIVFIIIGIAFVTMSDIRYQEFQAVREEQTRLNTCFNQAIDSGTLQLKKNERSCVVESKELATASFFQCMFASLGIMEDIEQRERLFLSVPVIAVVDFDGVYINYCKKEVTSNGTAYMKREWTEKIPYCYRDNILEVYFTLSDILTISKQSVFSKSDNLLHNMTTIDSEYGYIEEMNPSLGEGYWLARNDLDKIPFLQELHNSDPGYFLWDEKKFTEVKMKTIAETIEDHMKSFINCHNNIARDYGIEYEFHLPQIDSSIWDRAIKDCSFFVLFQGYPYKGASGHEYQRYSFHAADIQTKAIYYLEKKQWYYLYHKKECKEWSKKREEEMLQGKERKEIICETLQECAEYGAFPCLHCNRDYQGYHPER